MIDLIRLVAQDTHARSGELLRALSLLRWVAQSAQVTQATATEPRVISA